VGRLAFIPYPPHRAGLMGDSIDGPWLPLTVSTLALIRNGCARDGPAGFLALCRAQDPRLVRRGVVPFHQVPLDPHLASALGSQHSRVVAQTEGVTNILTTNARFPRPSTWRSPRTSRQIAQGRVNTSKVDRASQFPSFTFVNTACVANLTVSPHPSSQGTPVHRAPLVGTRRPRAGPRNSKRRHTRCF